MKKGEGKNTENSKRKKEKKERKRGKRDERLFRNEPMEFEAKHDPESLCIVNIYRGPFNEVREMDESFFFYSLFLFCYFFFLFFFFTSKEEKRIGSTIDRNNFFFHASITYENANANS